MKKTIITPVLALILGFIAGFCFRDYYMKKQNNVKTPEIETKDKTSNNGTIPHIHHIQENEFEDIDYGRYEDFGPV